MVKWKKLENPKEDGGWDLNNILMFKSTSYLKFVEIDEEWGFVGENNVYQIHFPRNYGGLDKEGGKKYWRGFGHLKGYGESFSFGRKVVGMEGR
jgi:hypothetical protein